jgi:hypothetical protein
MKKNNFRPLAIHGETIRGTNMQEYDRNRRQKQQTAEYFPPPAIHIFSSE